MCICLSIFSCDVSLSLYSLMQIYNFVFIIYNECTYSHSQKGCPDENTTIKSCDVMFSISARGTASWYQHHYIQFSNSLIIHEVTSQSGTSNPVTWWTWKPRKVRSRVLWNAFQSPRTLKWCISKYSFLSSYPSYNNHRDLGQSNTLNGTGLVYCGPFRDSEPLKGTTSIPTTLYMGVSILPLYPTTI